MRLYSFFLTIIYWASLSLNALEQESHPRGFDRVPVEYQNIVLNQMKSIYGNKNIKEVDIIQLEGGYSGTPVFKTVLDDKVFVIKTFPINKYGSSDVIHSSILAGQANVGPKVYYPQTYNQYSHGIVVMEYLSGKPLDLEDIILNEIELADLLQKVHSINAPKPRGDHNSYCLFNDIKAVIGELKTKDKSFDMYVDALFKIETAFTNRPASTNFVHGDLHPEHILHDASGKLKIIDWGISGIGDPILDVVEISKRIGFNTSESLGFFKLYLGYEPSKRERAHFLLLYKLSCINDYINLVKVIEENHYKLKYFIPSYTIKELEAKVKKKELDITEETLNIIANIDRVEIENDLLNLDKLISDYME